MAGEWLKFDCTLPEKQETLAITAAMGWEDPDTTVGKLMRLFRWFDQQTIDGNAPNVTPALLDRVMGVSGFVSAVVSVGWIVINERGLSLANFDRHNGATAKSRVLTAKRVANHKANALGNAQANAGNVSGALPRVEKSREEKKNTEEPCGFVDFWGTWPSGDRKQAKGKCLEVWKKARFEPVAALVIAHVVNLKNSVSWMKNGGEFIPAPLVYLNKRSWEGAEISEPSAERFV